MNGLLVGGGASPDRRRALDDAHAAFLRQGLREAVRVPVGEEGVAIGYAAPGGASQNLVSTPDGCVASVGPMWYRGRAGEAALRAVLDEVGPACDPDRLDRDAFLGSFTLFVARGARAVVLGDPLGLQRVFVRRDAGVVSTSWLAALQAGATRTLDRVAALEYLLHGAVHGEATPVVEVEALPPQGWYDAAAGGFVACARPALADPGPFAGRREDAVVAVADHYRHVFATVAGDEAAVRMALSGGFDSRLLLAGLAALGVRPELFVYGGEHDGDVRVARRVAAGEGLALEVVDKLAAERDCPPLSIDGVEAACLYFDGLPVDGILDRGVDRATRHAQHAGGALVLNGGGGEILRNFFHLPDRTLSPGALWAAFYGGVDASAVRRAADARALRDRMTAGIARSVSAGPRMNRRQVELAYPLFRCRYWMGRNNAVSNRWGRFATPLVDPVAARLAASLPIAWKQAGAFEADVIAALHPRVAAYPSAYGFPFTRPPGWRARASEWSTCARPVRARPWIARLRRALSGEGPGAAALSDARAALGDAWAIDALVDVRRLRDEGMVLRAATLEHLVASRAISIAD